MFCQCLALLFAVSINAVYSSPSNFLVPLPEEVDYIGEIPNCRDGEKPLLAADVGVYTCDKNCPQGFRCEYKTTDDNTRRGICCPNLEELERIYNKDEKLDKAVTKSNV